jgi:hypothetical protein
MMFHEARMFAVLGARLKQVLSLSWPGIVLGHWRYVMFKRRDI